MTLFDGEVHLCGGEIYFRLKGPTMDHAMKPVQELIRASENLEWTRATLRQHIRRLRDEAEKLYEDLDRLPWWASEERRKRIGSMASRLNTEARSLELLLG